MPTALTVEELIQAAIRLSREDRQRLIHALTAESPERKGSITELRGLGKEIWQGQNAQVYIDAERDAWGD